jgi:GH25 family lysozyme M1 (1,4-beta-N-acetylmuramidase)
MATKGIDVSKWQGNIDWAKVKAAGIEFAMLRGGFGKTTSQLDSKFEQNYRNAKAAGMPVGVYHYSYAKSVEDAKKEAQFCLSYLKGKQFEYPIAFDIEDNSQANLGKSTLTAIAKAFCEEVEKAGYYVCIYANLDWLKNRLDMIALSDYDVWVAQWASKCTYGGAYGMWQYADKGRVNGIDGFVDLDEAYKNYPNIMKSNGLNGFSKTGNQETPKPTQPAKPTTYKKGQIVILNKTPLYISATAKKPSSYKTGTYYIYDGEKVNGRYKITARKFMCGLKPSKFYVTGWVELK